MKTRIKREVHVRGVLVDWSSTVHARVTWSRGFPGARSGRKSPLSSLPPHRQFLPKVGTSPPLYLASLGTLFSFVIEYISLSPFRRRAPKKNTLPRSILFHLSFNSFPQFRILFIPPTRISLRHPICHPPFHPYARQSQSPLVPFHFHAASKRLPSRAV